MIGLLWNIAVDFLAFIGAIAVMTFFAGMFTHSYFERRRSK